MSIQNGKLSHLQFLILIVLMVVVSPTRAQQEPSQPSLQESPDPKTAKTKEETADPGKEKDKQSGQVGKSKLERETGTVNDRIFEVLPN